MAEALLQDSVAEIALYPIKSCQAATVDGAVPQGLTIGPTGFTAGGFEDRGLMLVDSDGVIFNGEKGRFFGQQLAPLVSEDGAIPTVAVGDIVAVPALAAEPNITLRSTA
jgi:hypothetical protein